ncbi:hypothetical protein GOODEAATRI_022243 [Goodea atripinnis]|uniref:Uncharacterized protein n=1 Tax=Goodea atripinnis TaxID=208336 RepID=A0ABV0P6Z6_9TELE
MFMTGGWGTTFQIWQPQGQQDHSQTTGPGSQQSSNPEYNAWVDFYRQPMAFFNQGTQQTPAPGLQLFFRSTASLGFPTTTFLRAELPSLSCPAAAQTLPPSFLSSLELTVPQPAEPCPSGFCPLCGPPPPLPLLLHIFALSRVAPATVAPHWPLALKQCSCFQIRPLGFDPRFPLRRVVPVDTSFLLVFCGRLHILVVSCSGGCERCAYRRCRTFLEMLSTSWFILGCVVLDLGTVVVEFAQVIKW